MFTLQSKKKKCSNELARICHVWSHLTLTSVHSGTFSFLVVLLDQPSVLWNLMVYKWSTGWHPSIYPPIHTLSIPFIHQGHGKAVANTQLRLGERQGKLLPSCQSNTGLTGRRITIQTHIHTYGLFKAALGDRFKLFTFLFLTLTLHANI